jgi:glucose dehydrogenase
VKDLKVAWTFSTGVLRGHEGSPLVIGDTMYVHTPFPNNVFALDLNEPGRSSGSMSQSRIRSHPGDVL